MSSVRLRAPYQRPNANLRTPQRETVARWFPWSSDVVGLQCRLLGPSGRAGPRRVRLLSEVNRTHRHPLGSSESDSRPGAAASARKDRKYVFPQICFISGVPAASAPFDDAGVELGWMWYVAGKGCLLYCGTAHLAPAAKIWRLVARRDPKSLFAKHLVGGLLTSVQLLAS